MQAALTMGVFGAAPGPKMVPVKYRNNRVSAVLRRDHPNSVHYLVRPACVELKLAPKKQA